MNSPEYIPWTFSWDLDDILDRHENEAYIPKNYPNLPDKKWWAIYHRHATAMRILEKQEALESQKTQELLQKQILISRRHLYWTLQELINKKEQKHQAYLAQKKQAAFVALKNSWNTKEYMAAFLSATPELIKQDDDALLWLYNYLIISLKSIKWKKQRKNNETTIGLILEVLIKKWLPTWIKEIQDRISQMSPETIKKIHKSLHTSN